jgi:hypothetical protein
LFIGKRPTLNPATLRDAAMLKLIGDTLSAFPRMKFTEVAMHHTHIVFIAVAAVAVFILFAIFGRRNRSGQESLDGARMANDQAREAGRMASEAAQRASAQARDAAQRASDQAMRGFNQGRPF